MEQSLDLRSVLKLLEYIRQIAGMRQSLPTRIDDEVWHLFLDALPVDPKRIRTADPSEESFAGVLLEVEKPAFSPCPELPFELIGWVRTPWRRYETAEIEVYEEREKEDARVGRMTERFLDSGVRVAAFEDWKRKRALWRAGELVKARTQELFMSLYEVFDRLRQSEDQELILGCGCFTSGLDKSVDHPLLLRHVELRYEKSGKMQVVDTMRPTEVYSDILSDMPGLDGAGIRAFAAMAEAEDPHPLAPSFGKFLEAAAPVLTPNCRYAAKKFELLPTDWYILYPHPVLFVRRHSEGLAKAVSAIIAHIEGGGTVPPALLAIASGGAKPETGEAETDIEAARGESEDILLTRPANAEQIEVARRIGHLPAVAIEGPPGTGKTYTIANLLGHFLAKGQHVLVTSARQKALSVLKDKLPEGIRSLCVSLVGDAQGDMERSVEGILTMLSRTSAETLAKEGDALEKERQELLKALRDLRARQQAVIQCEAKRDYFTLGGKTWSLSRMADFLHRHEELAGRLPEPIEGEMPLSDGELAALYATNPLFDAESLAEMAEELPKIGELPPPDVMEKVFREESHFEEREKALLDRLEEVALTADGTLATARGEVCDGAALSPEGLSCADARYAEIDFDLLHKDWARETILAGREGGPRRAVYEMLGADIARVQQLKGQALTQFFGKEIAFDGSIPLDASLVQTLSEISDAFGEGRKLSAWARLRHRGWGTVLASFRIDGQPLGGRADCRMAMQYVRLALAREKVRREWAALLEPFGIEPYDELKARPDDFDDVLSARWREIASLLDWYGEVFDPLMAELTEAGLHMDSLLPKADYLTPHERLEAELGWLESAYEDEVALIRLHYLEHGKREGIAEVRQTLQRVDGALARRLLAAVEAGAADAYAECFARLRRYEKRMDDFRERQRLLSRLSAAAPQWARQIAAKEAGFDGPEPPAEARAAWYYALFSKELARVPKEDVAALSAEVVRTSERARAVVQELTQKRAWQHLAEAVTGTSRQAALVGWSKATKKLGKGKGKYAARHRKEARACMKEAQAAVPAWIMPLSRVYEHLSPNAPKFDIIICDEAGQADITAIPLLYFAEKVIVVGDDKQTSPLAVGVDAASVQSIMAATIDGEIPHASLYTLDTSLYDLAQMHFAGSMLTEHFRSVPEIIGFSNQLSYDGRIRPLRESGALLPFAVCHVAGHRAGDVNEAEALYAVALMAACLEEPAYASATFGAISLLGLDQAKRIRELAAEHIGITALEEHRFLAGGPAEFQGDERDIVFLSLVDSQEGEGLLRLCGEGKAGDNVKRLNVAVSRARDQVFLLHSMAEEDLKSGDLRRALLAYAQMPDGGARQSEGEETSFETAVKRELTECGYHVVTHFMAGTYPVDMVVEAGGKKAAIACDGERWIEGAAAREKERQTAVLERLGWHFLHLRGSAYYRDPAAAIGQLAEWLRELGITPVKGERAEEKPDRSVLAKKIMARATDLVEEWQTEEE